MFIRETKQDAKERLRRYFHRYQDPDTCQQVLQELITQQHKEGVSCPHCNSLAVVCYGRYKDRQRYKCNDCRKTFNDLTHTPLHRTHHPDKWIKFLECMIHDDCLRTSAIKVGVCYVTLFYWRHKILQVLQLIEKEFEKDIPKREEPIERIPAEQPPNEQPPNGHAKLRNTGIPCKTPPTYNFLSNRNAFPTQNTAFYLVKYRQKPYPGILTWEQEPFRQWIRSFDRIKVKYFPRYAAWFRFLQKVGGEHEFCPSELKYIHSRNELPAMKQLLATACSIRLNQTYTSVRVPL
ncbi:IS1/IS1595 family N-terminal zinc-binding domain-containing protein [Effusibacillus lacus]|uniref:IS1/IS1595 family N-terminal zinc-binding domain-containing protein n=1 Tax=Effusibacillus lacus TaxID=1348429 RepID=UPI000BB87781|nr:hypothetical protein [Effusibacillus lacus]TCS71810.1 transposase-like protein [Effusibacillus lacus]